MRSIGLLSTCMGLGGSLTGDTAVGGGPTRLVTALRGRGPMAVESLVSALE